MIHRRKSYRLGTTYGWVNDDRCYSELSLYCLSGLTHRGADPSLTLTRYLEECVTQHMSDLEKTLDLASVLALHPSGKQVWPINQKIWRDMLSQAGNRTRNRNGGPSWKKRKVPTATYRIAFTNTDVSGSAATPFPATACTICWIAQFTFSVYPCTPSAYPR